VLVLAVVALEVPLVISLRERVDAEVEAQALNQAEIVSASLEGNLIRGEALDGIVERAARAVRGRVIVVGAQGRLLADSAGDERLGIDYGSRPEIATALAGETAQQERRSETLDETILATAVPVLRPGSTEAAGAVRVTQSVDAVGRATWRATVGLIAIGLLVLVLGLAAGALIAGQVAGPVRRLDEAARRVADGDLSARAKVEGSAEQQRLARTFNDMTARLERLVASQREFVADASHQLRTLVTELLVLSQAGELDAPAERVDLEDAARRAAARWDVEVSGGPAQGFCSPADLDRALDALVENALHYGNGRVEICSRPGALDVLDRGPGLSEADLAAAFERFHRGAAGRAGPTGTGLGLPIARELARRWGGDVTLANRDGGGARATITFPGA
jgi:signal transduction histidine kinase